jgi:hypothetical protein
MIGGSYDELDWHGCNDEAAVCRLPLSSLQGEKVWIDNLLCSWGNTGNPSPAFVHGYSHE